MSHVHWRRACPVCKRTVAQCRCAATDKPTEYIVCPDCRRAMRPKAPQETLVLAVAIARRAAALHCDPVVIATAAMVMLGEITAAANELGCVRKLGAEVMGALNGLGPDVCRKHQEAVVAAFEPESAHNPDPLTVN